MLRASMILIAAMSACNIAMTTLANAPDLALASAAMCAVAILVLPLMKDIPGN